MWANEERLVCVSVDAPTDTREASFSGDSHVDLEGSVDHRHVAYRHDRGSVVVVADARTEQVLGGVAARDRQFAQCHAQSVTPRTSNSSRTSTTPATRPMTSTML